ncbi:hypothetical protein [Lysinibacillus capsici]|uniref:hypothetical protein n=1 Tax=Lysinibacillus capsici TaxID=2115968 RepID=UPI002E1A879D|nr:hypothetical protein [Lysinibacillus capsici]
METIVENQRLERIIIKHHSKKVQDYYNSATSDSEKDNRSNAIKFYEIGAYEFEDLPMVEATIGRIIGEFKRAGNGAYKGVEVLYQNVLEAAFAYFVDNHDHFYVRTKLAFADGIDKYELHRREQHYTSSSVFWLLKLAHDDVHKPYYMVKYHKGKYLIWERFTNKEELRKSYGLSRKQLELALELGTFKFEGIDAQIQMVESKIASFEVHLESAKTDLDALINFFNHSNDIEKKSSLNQSIVETRLLISTYEQLFAEDRAYNEKVKHLRGMSAIKLWNEKAAELRNLYKSNKSVL